MLKSKTYDRIGRVNFYPRRQKNIRLSLRGEQVRVSYPHSLRFAKVEAFVLAKTDWILKHRQPRPALSEGRRIGREHVLRWQSGRLQAGIQAKIIYARKDDEAGTHALIKEALKREAQTHILPLAEEWVQKTQLKPAAMRVRYMKTQWGSCSNEGKISLNSALVYLEKDLIKYVIVHELCHLRFLNHSPLFWRLLEQHLSDSKALRQKLRELTINLVMSQAQPLTPKKGHIA